MVLPGSVTETLTLRGLALRTEQVLCAPGVTTVFAESGQRVAAGQAVAELAEGELLCSPGSALFFSDTDGYEFLDPSLSESLDARGLEALMAQPPQREKTAIGRLVTGRDWIYAALASQSPPPGDYELLFEGAQQAVPARLLRSEDGLLLFRLTAREGLMSLRTVSAQLLLRRLSGLELPVSAVHFARDGTTTVNILTVHGPESRTVTLIYRDEERCLAALDSLTSGSTVIIG